MYSYIRSSVINTMVLKSGVEIWTPPSFLLYSGDITRPAAGRNLTALLKLSTIVIGLLSTIDSSCDVQDTFCWSVWEKRVNTTLLTFYLSPSCTQVTGGSSISHLCRLRCRLYRNPNQPTDRGQKHRLNTYKEWKGRGELKHCGTRTKKGIKNRENNNKWYLC